MKNKPISEKSRLREIIRNPVGRDIINRLLSTMGKELSLVDNPIVGSIRLGSLPRLTGGMLDGSVISTIIELLNSVDADVEPRLEGGYEEQWWKDMVVYQIYPRSFMDTNGDGIGDLRGIIEKLDYLSELGATALWLTPVCDSPNDDNGYDIRNYRDIMAEFGTMADYEELLEKAHARGMKVIMDMVLNHCSDEHEWFRRALAGEQKYKDYFYFRDGSPDTPPNNWLSFFSGSAWNYYPEVGQWALHLFSKKQMDLNWNNPDLREELYDILNFWLDKGVDGFRLDVINYIGKDERLPDGSEAIGAMLGYRGIEHYFFARDLHERLRELRAQTTGPSNAFTVGETPGTGINMNRLITDSRRGELDTVFCFDHLNSPGKDKYDICDYDLEWVKKSLSDHQLYYGKDCWNSIFFENHDNQRVVSKIIRSNLQHRDAAAKMIAVITATLAGTPFIYQGQELGMMGTHFEPHELRDVEAINLLAEKKDGLSEEQIMERINFGGRDHSRLPMQWDATENVGFTTGTPWIKPAEHSEKYNAQAQTADPDSVFCAYKTLFALRASAKTLRYGDFIPAKKCPRKLFCYYRKDGDACYYIEINMSADTVKRPALPRGAQAVYCSCGAVEKKLRPYEANIYLCK